MSGPDPLVGTVLDGIYRIDRLLGQGGMGSVYQATQTRLDKRVAIKVMSRDLTGNPEALLRFRREAQVTSQLGHPNIVQVFDFGTTPEGAPFMAMELLEGEDLETRLQRVRRLAPTTVAAIVKQVASALAATHTRGIVHRDLKPANIFLLNLEGATDFVKVVDFGISKVRSASARLTRPAMLMGSPQFMSPEQAAGQSDAIDHRTDQWALACIAFEAMAGRAVFVGDDVPALLYQVIHAAPPSLTALAPELPAQLDAVMKRALAKPPGERYESVGAFAAAFAQAALGGRHATKLEYTVTEDTGPLRTLMDGAPAVKDWAVDTAYPPQAAAPEIAAVPAQRSGTGVAVGPRGTAALPQGSLGAARSLGLAQPMTPAAPAAPPAPPASAASAASATAPPAAKSGPVATSLPAAKPGRAEATARAAVSLFPSVALPAVAPGPEDTPAPEAAASPANTSGERGAQVTTLSRSVGELTPPGASAVSGPRARKVIWLAAGVVCVGLLALLMAGPRGARTPSPDSTPEMATGQPALPSAPGSGPALPAAASSTTAPATAAIELLEEPNAARPPGPQPPAPRRAPAIKPNPIADPAAPVQKQPLAPPSRRKPKLFQDL